MSRMASSELEPLVNNFEHLAEKRRASEALQHLRKIASLVKPLMRQRNWRVGTLAEFYPQETNLLGLNINRGEKICLRLRYPGDDTQFLPVENVVDTMLHELAHNVVGPHNQEFHALWDKLRDEHEALLRKGYTGEGFLGRGNRLGGRGVPISEARRLARASAERRRNLTAGSGQKLGGQGIMRGQNPRAVIAAAAEKRMRIERGCASATDRGRQIAREEEVKKQKVTRTTVDHEDEDENAMMQAYIEMIQEDEKQQFGKDYVRPSQDNPAGYKGVHSPPGLRTAMLANTSTKDLREQQHKIEQNLGSRKAESEHGTEDFDPPSGPPPLRPNQQSLSAQEDSPPPETWTCEICTLVNPLQFLSCDACGMERPAIYHFDQPSPPPQPSCANGHSSSRPQINSSKSQSRDKSNALKPKQNVVDSLRKFEEQEAYKKSLPIGWRCGGCGNFMEQQWWTCSVCGRMKITS